MAELTTIARPYAEAAFDHAHANNSVDSWSQMLQAAEQIVYHDDMQSLLGSSQVSKTTLADLVNEIGGQRFDEVFKNFIRLLVENHRLSLIREIAAVFEQLRADANQTIEAHMQVAQEPSEEQLNKIRDSLRARLKREVKLEYTVDPDMLGGAIIRAGDLVIDGSARGQLHKLAARMSQ